MRLKLECTYTILQFITKPFLEGILSLKLCTSRLPRCCVSNLQHSPEEKPFLTYSPEVGNGREDLLRPTSLGSQLHSAFPAEPASSRDIAEGQKTTVLGVRSGSC